MSKFSDANCDLHQRQTKKIQVSFQSFYYFILALWTLTAQKILY